MKIIGIIITVFIAGVFTYYSVIDLNNLIINKLPLEPIIFVARGTILLANLILTIIDNE